MAVKLLTTVRIALRTRHYSRRTEETYVNWIKRFVRYSGLRHPKDLGAPEVTAFLSHLAVDKNVSASTQNQALGAVLFLYREVLGLSVPWLSGIVPARRTRRLPVVLTRDEVRAVLAHVDRPSRLVTALLYGSGLRLLEALQLRVKDVDFGSGELRIRMGKGQRDRVTMLPARLQPALGNHLRRVKRQHEHDRALAPDGLSSHMHSRVSIRARGANGPGSGCSRRVVSTSISPQESGADIIRTKAWCRGHSMRQ